MREPYVIVTETDILEYDQEPWEQLEDGSWWFKANSVTIYPCVEKEAV